MYLFCYSVYVFIILFILYSFCCFLYYLIHLLFYFNLLFQIVVLLYCDIVCLHEKNKRQGQFFLRKIRRQKMKNNASYGRPMDKKQRLSLSEIKND